MEPVAVRRSRRRLEIESQETVAAKRFTSYQFTSEDHKFFCLLSLDVEQGTQERKKLDRKTDSVACTRKFGSTEHEQNQVRSKPRATSSPAFSSPHLCSAAGRHLFLAWKFPSKTPRCTAGQQSPRHLVDEADGRVLLAGAAPCALGAQRPDAAYGMGAAALRRARPLVLSN